MPLPPFLQPESPGQVGGHYFNAVFPRKQPFHSSRALWWPSKTILPTTVILFIPGNPAILNFYVPFLESIYEKDTTSSLAIFAWSHTAIDSAANAQPRGLLAQVEGSIEALDAVRSTYGVETNIVVVGHSVGGWLALQLLKVRSTVITRVFLLFPTLCHIADTTNGQQLSWLFSQPMRTVLYWVSHLARILPDSFLRRLYPSWPEYQISVLRSFLNSPPTILAALRMADDEMHTILDLDVHLLNDHRDKLCFYFAEQDNWVAGQLICILNAFKPPLEQDRVIHGPPGIPHSFCINHSQEVAHECHVWLNGV